MRKGGVPVGLRVGRSQRHVGRCSRPAPVAHRGGGARAVAVGRADVGQDGEVLGAALLAVDLVQKLLPVRADADESGDEEDVGQQPVRDQQVGLGRHVHNVLEWEST